MDPWADEVYNLIPSYPILKGLMPKRGIKGDKGRHMGR